MDDTEAPGRRSSTISLGAVGATSLISGNLILAALESINQSKDARAKPLKAALAAAIHALSSPLPPHEAGHSGTVDPHIIFAPLRLACETKSVPLMITALDCIGKLVAYDFFVDRAPTAPTDDDGAPLDPVAVVPLADLVTNTVCDCFSPSPTGAAATGPTTQHDTLLLRLLSSLLSLILSSALAVHQASLLKAVRTVYNVFLMGSPGTVQTVAQATLGQIVGGVFGRISAGEAAANGVHYPGLATPSLDQSRSSSVADLTLSEIVEAADNKENGGEKVEDKVDEKDDDEVTVHENAGTPEGDVAPEEHADATDATPVPQAMEDGFPAPPAKDEPEEIVTLYVPHRLASR